MVLYSVATVAWALWQLYHNSEALHAVFSPLVDAVYARFEATLAALDAFLDFFTNWFVGWRVGGWVPASVDSWKK